MHNVIKHAMTHEVVKQDFLHGESAARRQAITELLFFASVGDLFRCRKISAAWRLTLTDPQTADYDKRTPLHLAAAEGCYSVVAWLLKQGALVNAVDRFKRTPLEDAVRGDHGEVASMLIQHGAKIVAVDGEMVDLADSPLAGNVRLFTGYDPEWEIEAAAITMLEKIGEGEFGIVHKAHWHGTTVAVKILKDIGTMAIGDFRTELNVLQKVHHPHTVQFLGAVTKQQPFMIVTEYMTGGSLLDYFKRMNATAQNPKSKAQGPKGFSIWRSVQLALDCARGLAYLHNRSPQAVIHRDLKPANLMMGGPKTFNAYHRTLLHEELGVLKIADFGLSKSLKLAKRRNNKSVNDASQGSAASAEHSHSTGKPAYDNNDASRVETGADGSRTRAPSYKLTGETGSYRYMAPEVFRHEQYNNKVDLYGFAMIMYQLFEGVPPFFSLDPVDAARAAAHEHRRPTWSAVNINKQVVPEKIRSLVEMCWAPDPEERPEFDHVVVSLEAILRELTPVITEGQKHDGCCSVQ